MTLSPRFAEWMPECQSLFKLPQRLGTGVTDPSPAGDMRGGGGAHTIML